MNINDKTNNFTRNTNNSSRFGLAYVLHSLMMSTLRFFLYKLLR